MMKGISLYTLQQKTTYHQVKAYSKTNRSHERNTGAAKETSVNGVASHRAMIISTTNVLQYNQQM